MVGPQGEQFLSVPYSGRSEGTERSCSPAKNCSGRAGFGGQRRRAVQNERCWFVLCTSVFHSEKRSLVLFLFLVSGRCRTSWLIQFLSVGAGSTEPVLAQSRPISPLSLLCEPAGPGLLIDQQEHKLPLCSCPDVTHSPWQPILDPEPILPRGEDRFVGTRTAQPQAAL